MKQKARCVSDVVRIRRRFNAPARISCIALILCGFALTSCNKDKGDAKGKLVGKSAPNVFIIVMDATSAPYLGCYGDTQGTSPNIDKFAAESLLFEHAFSQASSTVPSTASLMTGMRPTTHRLSAGSTLSKRFKIIPELLSQVGMACYGFIGNPHAGAVSLGLSRGYAECVQVYAVASLQANRPLEELTHFRVTLPEDINDQVDRLLPRFNHSGQFAYIHYLQPHNPYDPPARFTDPFDPDKRGKCHCGGISWTQLFERAQTANATGIASSATIDHMEAAYRGNIKYVDEAFGKLVARLREKGLYDDSLIILMADHGEAFFKHKVFGHKVGLYDDMLHIPMIIKFPKSEAIAPRRMPQLVQTIDILPTVLDYLGVEPPGDLEGRSLMGLLGKSSKKADPTEVVSTLFNLREHAIHMGDYKLLHRGSHLQELYNVKLDPDETKNLLSTQKDIADGLLSRLDSIIDLTTGTTKESSGDLRADPRMSKLLDSIGYVGKEEAETDIPAPTTQPAATTQPSDKH